MAGAARVCVHLDHAGLLAWHAHLDGEARFVVVRVSEELQLYAEDPATLEALAVMLSEAAGALHRAAGRRYPVAVT